jgi:hypothetical protein
MEELGKSCSKKIFASRLDHEICALKFQAVGAMKLHENQEKMSLY